MIVFLDPLTSHTGKEGYREIAKKIWHWKEAIVANDAVPRTPPPIVVSLEEGRNRRVTEVLEMGASGGTTGSKKETWVCNVWRVPQQRDGAACGVYLLATGIALTRGWSLQDTTSAELNWVQRARAWFLKVALANTARAPIGPCARCGGVAMNAVIRAGARMCITCTGSSETKPLEVEDEECRPRPALPRSRPKVREHVVVEGWSPLRDPRDERGEPRPRVKTDEGSSAGQLGGVKGGVGSMHKGSGGDAGERYLQGKGWAIKARVSKSAKGANSSGDGE